MPCGGGTHSDYACQCVVCCSCDAIPPPHNKVLSDATLTILGEASGTELGAFTDPGSAGWNAKVATVCGTHDDSTSTTSWFKGSY